VEAVETAAIAASPDRPRRQARLDELSMGDELLLAAGDRPDPALGGSSITVTVMFLPRAGHASQVGRPRRASG
jgi:hypothetical protein